MDLSKIEQNTTVKEVYQKIGQERIFLKYFGDLPELGRKYRNPFRDDKSRGCWFWKASDGVIYLMDPATIKKAFTAIDIVSLYYRCDLRGAVDRVVQDFKMDSYNPSEGEKLALLMKERKLDKCQISWKERELNQKDLQYWIQYNITKEILNKYRTIGLEMFWINRDLAYIYNEFDPAYGYLEGDWIKTYRPRASKANKFRNDYPEILEGYEQLPEAGDLLILTKGRKDVMTFSSIGVDSVACRSENTFPTSDQIEELNERFSNILIWFDNDRPGVDAAEELSSITGWRSYWLQLKDKDPSDFVKNNGPVSLMEIVNTIR